MERRVADGEWGIGFSLVFFGWFVAVFIWLATRALPKGGNLMSDAVVVAMDVASRFKAALLPRK